MTIYQIAVFGDLGERVERLLETLYRRLADLGVPDGFLAVLREDEALRRDPKAPVVGVYFASDPVAPVRDGLRKIVADAITVVPVVPDLEMVRMMVPHELQHYNAIATDPGDPELEALAGVVLENFGLLRSRRRLFISYRRTETRSIAVQLYEALQAQGFDVFLDTHGVRPGEPFQEILWHRLADTDLIVLLDSPDFLSSRWTADELAQANTTSVQILQLIWPHHDLHAAAAFSRPIQLSDTDFVGGVTIGTAALLEQALVQRISVEVESLRARALAARYAYLVQEFSQSARSVGLNAPPQYGRFIVVDSPKGRHFVVPTIGVPDAARYHEVEDQVGTDPSSPQVVILYDERGVRDQWLNHMGWLDEQLRVRSLKVTVAATWLRDITA